MGINNIVISLIVSDVTEAKTKAGSDLAIINGIVADGKAHKITGQKVIDTYGPDGQPRGERRMLTTDSLSQDQLSRVPFSFFAIGPYAREAKRSVSRGDVIQASGRLVAQQIHNFLASQALDRLELDEVQLTDDEFEALSDAEYRTVYGLHVVDWSVEVTDTDALEKMQRRNTSRSVNVSER